MFRARSIPKRRSETERASNCLRNAVRIPAQTVYAPNMRLPARPYQYDVSIRTSNSATWKRSGEAGRSGRQPQLKSDRKATPVFTTANHVIMSSKADRNSLADTVARLHPRLLILDPFVRLHRIDENASGEEVSASAAVRFSSCFDACF
jgi:hypothetical protein